MMIMQPSKIFLTVLPPVIPPPTQLVIEGYFLILKHTHTDAHTCWYLWLSSLANALSSMVMLRHYSFLKSCPPSPRWTSLFCGWLQQFLHQLFCMYMCTHARTHTQNSSAKQKSIHAISLLKTLEWLPKILKKKKKKSKFLPRSTRPCKTWPSPNSSSYVPSRQISFLIHIHSTSISFLTSGPLHYLPPYESVSCSVVSGDHWL